MDTTELWHLLLAATYRSTTLSAYVLFKNDSRGCLPRHLLILLFRKIAIYGKPCHSIVTAMVYWHIGFGAQNLFFPVVSIDRLRCHLDYLV